VAKTSGGGGGVESSPHGVFVSRRNAQRTVHDRRLLVERVRRGRPVAHVAGETGISRSSGPRTTPHRTPASDVRRPTSDVHRRTRLQAAAGPQARIGLHRSDPGPARLEASAERLHLKRLHVVNDRAIGLTDSWVPEPVAPGLSDQPLIDGSLSRTLREIFELAPSDTNHYLEVGAANSHEARLLNTTLDAPLFVVWSVARLGGATACWRRREPCGSAAGCASTTRRLSPARDALVHPALRSPSAYGG
jgi:hypothetical protein